MYSPFLALVYILFVRTAQVSGGDDDGGPPADATGVKTITSPSGATIRYKEPGKDGICETTKGVNSYSGYVDLDNSTHMFFWFFEARTNAATAPLTLWLNGGPGSDSLIGLFQENGPCNVTEDLKTQLNPYAWNEVSNMLYLSQPIGVGFSYGSEEVTAYGRLPEVDPDKIVNTTELAAAGTWHILQGLLSNLPTLDSDVKSKDFNLWTESYGGHYGPSFFSYFYDHNLAIANGTEKGVELTMATLGIGNGIIDETTQAPYFPEFAVNNTYGIKTYNDTVYAEAKAAFYDPGMCKDQIAACAAADRTTDDGMSICANATDTCRSYVEGPYYDIGGNPYDIRTQDMPSDDYIEWLNLASTQNSIGVNVHYTSSNEITEAFGATGDFVYPQFIKELEKLIENGIRVALYYGDADYICNWFGGEAVSLAVNYTHADSFRKAGYEPFVVDGTEYGEVRQYGNFSFLRIYESGHEVPYYQPKASLEFFRRVLQNKSVSDGKNDVTGTYGTNGTAEATHVESGASMQTASRTAGGTASRSSSGTGAAVSPTKSPSAGRRRISMIWRDGFGM